MIEAGEVRVETKDGVGEIEFSHPKSNSLPAALLREIAQAIDRLGEDDECRVVVLRSGGQKAFCAGASFDEFLAISNCEVGQKFFMGFGEITLAIRRCPKFVVARVQGKVVGGGVGIVAAADYAIATRDSAVKLSELAIGIAPFVIGPAVQRKVGLSAFGAMAIDADWRDAAWAENHGLFTQVHGTLDEVDAATTELTDRLAGYSPEAMRRLKSVLWEGTEDWPALLEDRAATSGELMLSDYVKSWIKNFKQKK